MKYLISIICFNLIIKGFCIPQESIHFKQFPLIKPYLVQILVPDIEKTVEWYQKNLNFKILKKLEAQAEGIKIVLLESNGFIVEFVQSTNSYSIFNIIPDLKDRTLLQGIVKMAFNVSNIDSAAEALKNNGVKIRMEVTKNKKNGNKFNLFYDNNGNLLQFVQKNETSSNPQNTFTPCTIGILVSDLDKISKWYMENLGFKMGEKFESKDIQVVFLESVDFKLELVRNNNSVSVKHLKPGLEKMQIQGFTKLGFIVNDLELSQKILKNKGVKIKYDITEDEQFSTKFMIISDNEENEVQLFKKEINIPPEIIFQDLLSAIRKNDFIFVKDILEKNPELINFKDNNNRNPLHIAIISSPIDKQLVKLLIEKDVDLNAKDINGKTPLFLAAANGQKEIMKLLIENGADINTKDKNDETILDWSSNIRVFYYSKDLIDFLLMEGVDIPKDEAKINYMMHSAATWGHKNFVDALLKNGANIKSKNNNGGTLLHSVAASGLIDLIETLLSNGIDINGKDRYGWTPLHYAVMSGNKNIVEMLILKEADMKAMNAEGKRPIHIANENKNDDIVKLLISKGDDQNPPKFPILRGKYLGQKEPGLIPILFAPGIISTNNYEHTSAAFSPDGDEVYWSPELWKSKFAQIKCMKIKDDLWTSPQSATFSSSRYRNINPIFSPDGKKIVFTSNQSIDTTTRNENYHIWSIKKNKNMWTNPKPLDSTINSEYGEFGASISKNGKIYFGSAKKGNKGSIDIYSSNIIKGCYSQPINMGDSINTEFYESWPSIAPDESFLLFESSRPGGYGKVDIYISFHNEDGTWTKAINMGEKINSNGEDRFPTVTADGKFIFFTSDKNGNMDIYWVSSEIINEVKPKDLNKELEK